MEKDLLIRMQTYEYEQRIKYLEQVISDLEKELFKKDCQLRMTSNVVVKSVPSKRQEIVNAINYIKNKPVKTKQDKESLYSLEMVLKNMK